ncbi:hypothetical protein [Streptomyces tropicalis]|uniref:Butirosin biosynthesis protein H N-terminal domain-containing protein n=1 Tax=Streptomyces tropicalis TaxID=3034234 RepID=A0ABT6A329_9ACTN|nr:hypothetical protein [Streptomyces tropicalis]MDF3299064.1 hypothetical protein [Streptomyces tropicalis]
MDSHIVTRYDGTAVNCLTGSYSVLAGIAGRPVEEQTVFERGDGYLFQAGLDESGYPEYIFPVEEAGALGMARSGFTVHKEPIDFDAPGPHLEALLERHGAVIVWVNTAHLNYADVYRDNNPYLHAVVVRGIAADHGHVDVHDSLVVGTQPFSCRAVVTFDDLVRAAADRIKSDAHDAMGFFYAVSDDLRADGPAVPGADGTAAAGEGRPDGAELSGALTRQAERFFAEARFREAIRRYQALCEECFAGPAERAALGARRLFHHASVLYAVPSLRLMARSLQVAGASERSLALHDEAARHWEAMGVLALRHEATSAPSVRKRITQRFEQLDDVTARLWESVAADSGVRHRS